MRRSLSVSVRRASTQRLSASPVMRHSAVTARRIDASARHELAQRDSSTILGVLALFCGLEVSAGRAGSAAGGGAGVGSGEVDMGPPPVPG